jgi:subtilisin family serine protease
MASRVFRASARLFSARVTDDNNEYDENELIEHQLEEAIEYFLNNYPSLKVINISLGDRKLIYSDGDYQFRFAAAIDDLAYRYRDREVVFVVSAGNRFPNHISAEEAVENYPSYLLSNEARIIDPATSAIALTVGGLSYGAGRDLQHLHERGIERLVAGERGWPSPFTRTGFGVDGAIKPEVVDFAGDIRFERGRLIAENPAYAGMPTTARDFGPPAGRLFRTVSGTSFASPRVANLAARLFREFPSASSNLIRALIADSARIPQSRPEYFSSKQLWDEDVLQVYG